MQSPEPDVDALVSEAPDGADPSFFDRFYFNLHGTDPTPLVMIGGGVYPPAGVVDGYVLVVDGDTQHNLRFSDLSAPRSSVGPLRWETVEPLKVWRLRVEENPLGLELDVTWTARTAAWRTEDIRVDNGRGGTSDFSHYFQSGTYTGSMTWNGATVSVDGWTGQRDRSRGVRVVAGGQGMHLWVQAQLADRSVAFIMDETRTHEMYLCDGAVLHTDGSSDPIVDLQHDLTFDAGLDFRTGRLVVTTQSGEVLRIDVDGTAGGGFLSGGGYGGWHGKAHGSHHLEHDSFALDGSVSPRTLDMPLTDRPARFFVDGAPGVGVFEFAVTRSPSYAYVPSLPA
ncbi:DUF7064 domain-containing protein [Nocardioides pantholopis]|uniref:DUF7064 domain-containing protein n=1 Tax=Nocardioides pantholopis TaxID=2483798 RepID=UPI0019D270E5|nr:hypothetical protein [Nocardioides pantholopis]